MKTQIFDRYRDSSVIITTPHDDPDERVSPEYSGESQDVKLMKRLLGQQYGAYGHKVDPENTSNLDLQVAALKIGKGERYQVISSPLLGIPKTPEGRQS